MAKNTIYYLLYNDVPENVVPMVLGLQRITKYMILKKMFRRKKKSNACVICGGTTNLTLYHIKPIKDYPELQFRADNLKSVCRQCHKNLHELEF